MPEKLQDKTVYSLLDVTRSIRKMLAERYQSSFWVKAEMNKLNYYKQTGHCYPELVEKKDGKIIAQIRSHLWKADHLRADKLFRNVLNEPLKDGIKILFLAKITFDPVYGLSLHILEIDPSYTLGDLEREKQETILKLKGENVFYRNKELVLPMLPKRIAIISVESSKGYADFQRVLDDNPWGYKFFHMLFPSLLQGDKAVQAIIAQLRKIKRVSQHFDVVAIVRGGGGDVGLSCYNHYKLAKEVVLFPIPVITGIGHATNETVTEMISFANAITPTKIADYLLQQFHNFSVPVHDAEQIITDRATVMIAAEKNRFLSGVRTFRALTENDLQNNRREIRNLSLSLIQQGRFRFKNERELMSRLFNSLTEETSAFYKQENLTIEQHTVSINRHVNFATMASHTAIDRIREKLEMNVVHKIGACGAELSHAEKNINNMHPMNVLKRGYSITRLNGQALTGSALVKKGDVLETQLAAGSIISNVESTINKTDHE